jgi:hypothetical protein
VLPTAHTGIPPKPCSTNKSVTARSEDAPDFVQGLRSVRIEHSVQVDTMVPTLASDRGWFSADPSIGIKWMPHFWLRARFRSFGCGSRASIAMTPVP